MPEPLISVMMPCYNDASTLPMALASLLAQTYQNWECIFVDDGSTDHPQVIIDQIADPRIRSLALSRNYGRGVARQVALDQARGDYLCMLDADDWYYPDKLQRQLAIMENEKRIVLLSTAMASINRNGDIVGVHRRASSLVYPAIQKFQPQFTHSTLPSYAASMIRIDVAQQVKFVGRLRQAEDADWVLKVLWERNYAVLSAVTYAYNEYATTIAHKTLSAYRYHMQMNWLNRNRSWPLATKYIVQTWLKQTLYRFAFPLGFADYLVARRSQKPSSTDIQAFLCARRRVEQKLSPLSEFNFLRQPYKHEWGCR